MQGHPNPVGHMESGVTAGLLHQPQHVVGGALGHQFVVQVCVQRDNPPERRTPTASSASPVATSSTVYSPSARVKPPQVTTPSSVNVQSPDFAALITCWTSRPSRGPAAKSGDWTLTEDGVVTCGGFTLADGEYTVELVATGDADDAVGVLRSGGFVALDAAGAMLAFAVVAADAATPGFQYGVAAGEITPTSAVLWTRSSSAGALNLEVSRSRFFQPQLPLTGAAARVGNDWAVSIRIEDLQFPATRYYYRFSRIRSVSRVGTFETAPMSMSAANVRFAISGDADATAGGDGRPASTAFEVYGRMARRGERLQHRRSATRSTPTARCPG